MKGKKSCQHLIYACVLVRNVRLNMYARIRNMPDLTLVQQPRIPGGEGSEVLRRAVPSPKAANVVANGQPGASSRSIGADLFQHCV